MNNIPTGFKQTEVGVIPSDWEVKRLGDCLTQNPDYGINAAAVPYNEALPAYIRITDITEDGKYSKKNIVSVDNISSSSFFLEKGDIVFARTGASVGKTYLYNPEDGKLVFAGFLIRIKANHNNLIPEYLKFYTQTHYYWNWIKANSMRTGQPGVNSNEYKELPIPLPPTKAEQTAIATALNDADALITQLEKLIAKKRNIKQGAMQELLKPKEGWVVKKLGEIAKFRRGSFPQPYGLPKWYDDENGMPFVQVYDVDFNMKLKERTKQKISNAAKGKSVFVEKGSVVLTIQGSIGRIAMTQYDSYVDRTLLIFKNFLIPMDKKFFMYVVYQLFQIEKQKAPGGTIKTITKEKLSDFNIDFPAPKEQNKIAQILSDMDTEIEALEKKLEKYKMIKQGMMQNLLTGRVRLV